MMSHNSVTYSHIARSKEKKIKEKRRQVGMSVLTLIILIFLSLFILVPFYIILLTSFKDNAESMEPVFSWWPTMGFHLDGYKNVLIEDVSGGGESMIPTIVRGFLNTFLVVIPPTLIGLFTSSLSAYAYAKMNFRAKKLLFTILLLTMMVPGIIMLIPSYTIYDMLGFVNTFIPLMAPGMFGAAACVFFMRQYFYGIPTDLVESAKIDGLGHFRIFLQIMVPLSVSGLIAQGVLGFVGGYNDYMGPLIYLQTPEKYTLQIALKMSISTYSSDWQTVMAGSVVALVPTVILYIIAQRFFIEGIATTGLKA